MMGEIIQQQQNRLYLRLYCCLIITFDSRWTSSRSVIYSNRAITVRNHWTPNDDANKNQRENKHKYKKMSKVSLQAKESPHQMIKHTVK